MNDGLICSDGDATQCEGRILIDGLPFRPPLLFNQKRDPSWHVRLRLRLRHLLSRSSVPELWSSHEASIIISSSHTSSTWATYLGLGSRGFGAVLKYAGTMIRDAMLALKGIDDDGLHAGAGLVLEILTWNGDSRKKANWYNTRRKRNTQELLWQHTQLCLSLFSLQLKRITWSSI
jgi:hypothetical protein